MADRDRPCWLVARREIVEATRATSFRVTLIISAVALAAIIVIANLGERRAGSTQDVVVAGPDAAAGSTRDRARSARDRARASQS